MIFNQHRRVGHGVQETNCVYEPVSHSIYLTREKAVTDGERYPSADGFVSTWYNRNIRIYGNVLGASAGRPGRCHYWKWSRADFEASGGELGRVQSC